MLIGFLKWLLAMHVGMATTFSASNDPQNPRPYAACLHRDLDDLRDLVVAMRDVPCNTRLLVCLPRTDRCVVASVGDRGPYGRSRGVYRADLDLAPATRKKLKHNGFEPVYWAEIKD